MTRSNFLLLLIVIGVFGGVGGGPAGPPTAAESDASRAAPDPRAYAVVKPSLDPRNRLLKPACRYVPVPYPVNKDPAKTFNIELVGCGSSADYDAIFISAAQRWMSIITEDVEDYVPDYEYQLDCLTDYSGKSLMRCGYVDDIVISYTLSQIDGNGGVLGSGAPVFTRGSDWPRHRLLPITGAMKFDSSDFRTLIRQQRAEQVVLHEMGHVLGFGTLWTGEYGLGLVYPPNCETLATKGNVTKPRFLGKASTAVLSRIGYKNTTYPPVEGAFGPGTACSHWSEAYMRTELMTGFMARAGKNPLSVLTAASFRDLGYGVSLASPAINRMNLSEPDNFRGMRDKLKGCLQGWKYKGGIPFNSTQPGRRK